MSDCLSDWKFLLFFVKYQKGQITFTMAHGNGTKSSESRKQKTKRKDGKELGKSLLKRKKHDLYTSTRHTTDFEQNQGISSMTEQTSIDEFLARYVFEFWKLYLISDHVPTSLRLWFFYLLNIVKSQPLLVNVVCEFVNVDCEWPLRM